MEDDQKSEKSGKSEVGLLYTGFVVVYGIADIYFHSGVVLIVCFNFVLPVNIFHFQIFR